MTMLIRIVHFYVEATSKFHRIVRVA